jgi:hypothetical protein
LSATPKTLNLTTIHNCSKLLTSQIKTLQNQTRTNLSELGPHQE